MGCKFLLGYSSILGVIAYLIKFFAGAFCGEATFGPGLEFESNFKKASPTFSLFKFLVILLKEVNKLLLFLALNDIWRST